tara:strand:+ start:423 stop:806 length:384 start_codon:yes stop_codon:yes gene_type:complete
LAHLISNIIKIKKQNPLLSNQNISEKVGCSRQYVHRILRKADLPNAPRKRNVRFCKVCGSESTAIVHKGRCSYEYYRPEVVCSFCRVKFRRHLAAIKQGYIRGFSYIYCSRECYTKGRADKTITWAK